jgi:hypothetical protein
MHSRDPGKGDAEFHTEFESVLALAEANPDLDAQIADFTLFVFLKADFSGRSFHAKCVFRGATFAQATDFTAAKFAQGADFLKVTFTHSTAFGWAMFTHFADFTGATFMQNVDFSNATFAQMAVFSEARFAQSVAFSHVTFTQYTDFERAKFTESANFSHATFTQRADFSLVMFEQSADFSDATFTQSADFHKSAFTQSASFYNATFTKRADFLASTFEQIVDFRWAKFLEAVEFRQTYFRNDATLMPGPIFSVAQFSHPEAVIFYKTYLGQALFHNCDVSKINFSSVTWRERNQSGKRMVFEEEVDLNHYAARSLWPKVKNPDDREYTLIVELYQRLKKNYDDKCDYLTAGDFHYGEMEMKRLSSPEIFKSWRWLHRNLGLTAWYKYLSRYGESFFWPAFWLACSLLTFAAIYPILGLRYDGGKTVLSTNPTPSVVSRNL